MGAGAVALWVLALIGAAALLRWLWVLVSPRVRESPRRDGETFRDLSPSERARALAGHLNAPLVEGNRIELLVNGDRIFPALLGAIRGARDSLNFLTFVYWQGEVAGETAAALAAAARRGVEVRVLLDDFGSLQMDRELVDEMKEAGCRVCYFNPLRWYTVSRYNFRTHRKILVADGAVGFTGGVGIADEWTGDAEDSEHWRDDHFRVQGPAVHHLQGAFAQNWRSGTGEVLAGPRFFPPLEPAGGSTVVPILGEPRRASGSRSPPPTSSPARRWSAPSEPPPAAAWRCACWCPAATTTRASCAGSAASSTAPCSTPARGSSSTGRP